MTTAEILAAQNMERVRQWLKPLGAEYASVLDFHLDFEQVASLIVLHAEANQRIIKALSEALTQAVDVLDHLRAGRNPMLVNFDVIENVMKPALALAKEAQE